MVGTARDDEDRFARLYRECKRACVGYAAHLLAASGRNRHLCAFDAEEFYDAAWETYYRRREYLQVHDDHVARLNALIRDRVVDERRRSHTRKRSLAATATSLDATTIELAETVDASGAPGHDQRLVDRDELRRLLARVRNPADARALLDHELRGLTFEEIAAREGIGAEAARRRAARAVAQIRRLLEADGTGGTGGTGHAGKDADGGPDD